MSRVSAREAIGAPISLLCPDHLRDQQRALYLSTTSGTPVVMEEADSHPAMPMSLMVCAGSAGGADVLVAAASDSHARHDWQDVPAEVVRDLRALPELIDRALA